jgi:hypothetical protein
LVRFREFELWTSVARRTSKRAGRTTTSAIDLTKTNSDEPTPLNGNASSSYNTSPEIPSEIPSDAKSKANERTDVYVASVLMETLFHQLTWFGDFGATCSEGAWDGGKTKIFAYVLGGGGRKGVP